MECEAKIKKDRIGDAMRFDALCRGNQMVYVVEVDGRRQLLIFVSSMKHN